MNDSEIRNRFHQLRDEEALLVPHSPRLRGEDAVLRLRSGQAPRRVRGLRAALAAAAMILIIVAVSVLPFRHRAAPPTRESIVTWRAPTDFLLRTAGSDLLTTVPRIPDLPERK